MRLLMSDFPLPISFSQREENRYVNLSALQIAHCAGCFGCWVKTPGKCVIRDDAVSVYPLIARSSEVIYVSRVRYGSYDIPMKTMLERAIPIQKAFLRLYHGETHHVQRNVVPKHAIIVAYGCTDEARDIFRRLVARNANNMMFQSWKIIFAERNEVEEIVKKEIAAWERS